MADYSPIRDAFRDLNRMVLDKQQWDAQHELNVAQSERQDKLLDSQLQDQALQRQTLQLKADKAAYQMEEVGINRDDLINPENPRMVEFFDKNQNDIARSFGGDRFQDGILVDAEGSPFVQARHRYDPAKISYMYRVSADIDPVQEAFDEFDSLGSSLQELEDNKVSLMAGGHESIKQRDIALINRDIRNTKNQMNILSSSKLKNKAWQRKALMNKRRALDETLGEVLAIGADPDQAYAAHKNAMNDVAYQLELLDKGEKAATAMERGYASFLSSKGLTADEYPLHKFKNEMWDKDDGKSSDYKFHRQMVLEEWKGAVAEAEKSGVKPPKRPTEQEIRKSYTNSSNAALTVNQAAKNISQWMWDASETLDKASAALKLNRKVNVNDILKATVDLAAQPNMDMTKAQVAVLGAIDEGNYEVLKGDYSSIMPSDPAQSGAAPQVSSAKVNDVASKLASRFPKGGPDKRHKATGLTFTWDGSKWVPKGGVVQEEAPTKLTGVDWNKRIRAAAKKKDEMKESQITDSWMRRTEREPGRSDNRH